MPESGLQRELLGKHHHRSAKHRVKQAVTPPLSTFGLEPFPLFCFLSLLYLCCRHTSSPTTRLRAYPGENRADNCTSRWTILSSILYSTSINKQHPADPLGDTAPNLHARDTTWQTLPYQTTANGTANQPGSCQDGANQLYVPEPHQSSHSITY